MSLMRSGLFICVSLCVTLATHRAYAVATVSENLVVLGDSTFIFSTTDQSPNYASRDADVFFENILDDGSAVRILWSAFNKNRAPSELNFFYNSLGGVDSQLLFAPLNAQALQGVDLLALVVPSSAFLSEESDAIEQFLIDGGRLMVVGEYPTADFTKSNRYINDLLEELGATARLSTDTAGSPGTRPLFGSDIHPHPITAGVNEIDYGYGVRVDGGEQTLLSEGGEPVAVAEHIVPEPTSVLILLAASGVGLFVRRRG